MSRWKAAPLVCALGLALLGVNALAAEVTPSPEPLQPLPQLAWRSYLGTWYQVAWIPNRFQSACVSDTQARYRALPNGVEVLNRCKTAKGGWDEALGLARAVPGVSAFQGEVLSPAQLEVSFVPAFLRGLGVGWGAYWVISRPDHGRYAVVSEPSRRYLWVLSRTPTLGGQDRRAVDALLQAQGFDLSRVVEHPHTEGSDGLR